MRVGKPAHPPEEPGPPPPPLPPRRRGHRYREDTEDAASTTGEQTFAWLRQGQPDLEASAPASRPPGDHPRPPEQEVGRRAKRRAAEQDAAPTPVAPDPPTSPGPPAQVQTAEPTPPAPPPPPAVTPAPTPAVAPADKPAKPVAKKGWRRWVYQLTRINFGLSRDERRELDLHTRIGRRPRGSYQIGVLGLKGGAGKTTTTVTLGNTLAQVRGDRILVLDADPSAGNLAERTGRSSPSSIADLLADRHLSHYNDVRAHTSVNATNLEILPAAEYTAAQRGLSGADVRRAVDTVSKFYNLVLADCGAGLFDPVTQGVLETASAIVIVTSVSIDSARQAEIALDWLHNNGYQDLLSRACVVINHVAPGETNVEEKKLVRQFQQRVRPDRVVLLPWDKHIATGSEIQLDELGPGYRRRILELAAALSDDFEGAGRR